MGEYFVRHFGEQEKCGLFFGYCYFLVGSVDVSVK